uniref:Putative disease resistance RPP13-like protein 1 n=1 Tax=Rhizophora mucronata TaxID=61149 RepID=A0A2P2L5M7_RHIMU
MAGTVVRTQLLKKLKIKVIIINKVIDGAKDKQHNDPYVKQWLGELKGAVYEAEDLLDEISSEVQRWKIEAESQTTVDKVQDFVSSLNPFKSRKKGKLEEILEEDLIDQKNALAVIDDTGEKPSYGMEANKEAIVKWVLSEDANTSDLLAIVGMDGMGGTGKTSLLQHVDGRFNQKK